jgi:SAM-dependent methyltransferase
MSVNFSSVEQYYKELFKLHGVKPDALGWHKGNQFLRFKQLTDLFELEGATFCDVGCGFGDFNKYLEAKNIVNYKYLGIDIVEEFILEGKNTYNKRDNIQLLHGDFLRAVVDSEIDYSIASGTFNYRVDGVDCYDFVYDYMKKMFDLSKKAVAIDFLSDRVDYFHDHNFNYNPIKILELAYKLSKRVILNNSYFPFEFSIVIYKDDSFQKDQMHFNSL